MKLLIKLVLIITTIILAHLSFAKDTAESHNDCLNVGQLSWMSGNWQSKQGKTLIKETWHLENENLLKGLGSTSSNDKGKSDFIEYLSVQKISDDIFYIAKPPQNEFPVAFKLTDCSAQSIKFENITHDFPQYIAYQRDSKNSLTARVSSQSNTGFEIKFQLIEDSKLTGKDIVAKYVDAYNQQNLAEMMQYVQQDIHWLALEGSNISIETKNKQELIAALKQHFNRAQKSVSSLHGVTQNGNIISAIERISLLKDAKEVSRCSLSVYEFSNDKVAGYLIKNVWYYPLQKCD